MRERSIPQLPLAQLEPGLEADFFALLSAKEELTTRDGKPYFKVTFRDTGREATFPIWHDSVWMQDCRAAWTAGAFYKLRAVLRETSYGPQLDIRKIREVVEADAADGFDPQMCQRRSRFDPLQMAAELVALAEQEIPAGPLRELTLGLLDRHRAELLLWPAARRNHHAYVGGWLEHTLAVARNAVWLAHKYAGEYPDLAPPLRTDLVTAGAILHDIGKLREIAPTATGAEHTPSGTLVGHILQGRDLVREATAGSQLDEDTLLRLEHIILAHQRLPEWGSPKPPMTPEALLVHYADDIDAKFHMMHAVLREDAGSGHATSRKNVLHQEVYRGTHRT
jgi:3'-5' exoribonuclease